MANNSFFRRKSIDRILQDAADGHSDATHGGGMVRNLNVRDLTLMGIAAVVGAGIFSTIGNASFSGGPAVSLLFVFTAVACVFSALCYAQFASTIPIAGSAYTYAYTTFGELIAWIIGWDLLMEYAIGNIAVAISWSDYFTSLLNGLGLHLPDYITMDYLSAYRGNAEVEALTRAGQAGAISDALRAKSLAWQTAPGLGSVRFIADLPALVITVLITALCYVGIKESKTTSNILVLLKLAVVLAVIAVGAFYVQPGNYSPFAPNGVAGVLKGVSAVFFAYIGFDAISTTAEECENPQRDLPKAMMYALAICTVLYVLVALVLTGMVSYKELGVGDPLAFVFEKTAQEQGTPWLSVMAGVVAASAVVATTSVLLVFQLGQPRIWMSMSRDGLLPKAFSRLHPRFHTPSFSTIVTGFVVAVPALFMNLTEVTDLTSIGTLFAFVLVCGGILLLDQAGHRHQAKFRVPYINGKYLVPGLFLLTLGGLFAFAPEVIAGWRASAGSWDTFQHQLPLLGFGLGWVVLSWASFRHNLSLIPVLGLLTNFYLMSQLGITNWSRFLIWLVLGLVVYFSYGYRRSKLAEGGAV